MFVRPFSAALLACALAGCAVADPQQEPPRPSLASPSNAATPLEPAPIPPTATPGHAISAQVPPAPTPTNAGQTPTPTPMSPSLPAELDGLTPPLAQRFYAAQLGAASVGLTLTLTSGYRDPVLQQQIFDAKVAETGSRTEAARWVLSPEKSAHCQGLAVDVGPTITEMTWLESNQASYGLCRRYANEPWHFEPANADGSCPPMKESAAQE